MWESTDGELSMKVDIYRQSGLPIYGEDITAFRNEFREAYDDIFAAVEKKEKTPEQAQEEINAMEEAARAKYKTVDTIELPNSGSKWKALQMAVEAPVMVAVREEDMKVCLIIMDNGF